MVQICGYSCRNQCSLFVQQLCETKDWFVWSLLYWAINQGLSKPQLNQTHWNVTECRNSEVMLQSVNKMYICVVTFLIYWICYCVYIEFYMNNQIEHFLNICVSCFQKQLQKDLVDQIHKWFHNSKDIKSNFDSFTLFPPVIGKFHLNE